MLNIFYPVEVFVVNGKKYTRSAWVVNGYGKYFNKVNFYANIFYVNNIDTNKFQEIDSNIALINFFDKGIDFKSFIKNIGYYKNKIKKINDDELFFILYPYKFIGFLLGLILRNKKLIIRVVSDPIQQFTIHGNKFQRFIRKLLKPFVYIIYEGISRFIFQDNLIFYTANITTNKKNHINQIEIISCSNFNEDKALINNKITKKISFVGGEINRKGLNVLLKALNHTNHNVELNIIGMDKLQRKENIKLAQNLNIKFHGKIYKRDVFYKKLAQSDILVMPSFGEKQGKTQLEAMSVGVVPICADGGGTYRTIDNYYNGLLFKQLDWKALAKNIDMLYNKPELYEDLKQNALEYIQELSLEKQVKKMSKTINNFYNL
ncbi:glycosyltransferase family 4 protein [Candidatus Vampirococcus lugosii]|uniref:Glycosyltransferase involved in cell wall bisynthesis n=1 Tax=Candidatus Vampirococcus lugosii TaxID=2789015 RepID=A0ABS5QJV2_9BACT|nr:glycosyltransferase family 4 protein [Candidatus Vampirococcus lugosii]MBS8121546.1 Glycosyltransferase involved in cell wall bisynthesis [Candidatus Vampirococcus lugosii]